MRITLTPVSVDVKRGVFYSLLVEGIASYFFCIYAVGNPTFLNCDFQAHSVRY